MKVKNLIILLVLCFCQNLLAQNSSGFWLEGGLEKTIIKKKLDLGLDLGTRQRVGKGFNQFILEPNLSFRINKHIDLFSTYRFTNNISDLENRISIGSSWSDKIIKRTYLSLKLRFQSETSTSTNTWSNTARFKINLKHKIKSKKLYPYINSEIFHSLNPELYGFSNFRIGTGLSIKSLKRQSIKLGYFRGFKLKENITSKRNIFIISYRYDLK